MGQLYLCHINSRKVERDDKYVINIDGNDYEVTVTDLKENAMVSSAMLKTERLEFYADSLIPFSACLL